MRIHIIDNIYLTSDKYNFILNREYKTKAGGSRLKPIGFYSRLSDAVEDVLHKKMRQSTAQSLKVLTTQHSRLVQHLCGTLGSVKSRIQEEKGKHRKEKPGTIPN